MKPETCYRALVKTRNGMIAAALNAEIGRRIKMMRNRRGMDQRDLAHALGYSSGTTIHQMETGTRHIRGSDIAAIALTLNCTVRSLFPREGKR